MAPSSRMDSPTPQTQRSDRARPPDLPKFWTPHGVPGALVGQTLLGRYVVEAPIGQGGMAHVFRGRDKKLRGPVAIKVLRHLDPEAKRRFAAEVELLFNLVHPNVVHVIDRGDTPDGAPFTVLEHIAGEDLHTRLLKQGPLPWRDAVTIGIQVASALTALHALGGVHRDLKPSNLMLTSKPGKPLFVKLLDFGCAHLGDEFQRVQDEVFSPRPRRRTDVGDIVGTPDYLPPEAGMREADAGFDLFALGVTLYRLCTGLLPRETGQAPIDEVHPAGGAPPDLSRLIFAAMASDPDERLPSADHVRRGLKAIRAAHPEQSRAHHLFAGLYDRQGFLGVGASATAFRAYDRFGERELAIKVLRKDKPDPDDELRFERAAKILAHLDHPNIPTFYHAGLADGQRFVATQLCTGEPATKYTRPGSHLRALDVAQLGLQLASALEAVHAAGVLYRDLYPGNVLVDLGRTPKAWLFDFDHALVSPDFWDSLPQRWATPPERRRQPAREKPLTTVDYAAPEVRAGQPYTPASDVWALGLLLYRLLTGRRPFAPEGGEAQPASKLCRCPDALDGALLDMLSPDPKERASLAQVRELFEAALAQLDAEETPRSKPLASPEALTPAEPLPATAVPVDSAAAPAAPTDSAAAPAALASASSTEAPASERIASSEATASPPTTPVPAAPPPPSSETSEAPAPNLADSSEADDPRRRLLVAGLVALFLLGLVAVVTLRGGADTRPESSRPESPLVSPTRQEAATPPPTSAAPPTLDQALAAAEGPLRRCAERAGGEVMVELRADAGASSFSSIVVMTDDPAIDRCFRDVLTPLRFAPSSSPATRVPGFRP